MNNAKITLFSRFPTRIATRFFPLNTRVNIRAGKNVAGYNDKKASELNLDVRHLRFDHERLKDPANEVANNDFCLFLIENNTPYLPGVAHCAARPTTIQIPRTFGVSIFPSYVILYRCSGACSLQDKQHCAVTVQDAINVQIMEITGSNNISFKGTKIYNHTGCACDCTNSASDCDPKKQTWNVGSCSCNCIEDGSQCNSATQFWDTGACQCKCSMAPQHCDDHNKEWNTEICGCHCKKILQDECKAQNQQIDTATCQCVDDTNVL